MEDPHTKREGKIKTYGKNKHFKFIINSKDSPRKQTLKWEELLKSQQCQKPNSNFPFLHECSGSNMRMKGGYDSKERCFSKDLCLFEDLSNKENLYQVVPATKNENIFEFALEETTKNDQTNPSYSHMKKDLSSGKLQTLENINDHQKPMLASFTVDCTDSKKTFSNAAAADDHLKEDVLKLKKLRIIEDQVTPVMKREPIFTIIDSSPDTVTNSLGSIAESPIHDVKRDPSWLKTQNEIDEEIIGKFSSLELNEESLGATSLNSLLTAANQVEPLSFDSFIHDLQKKYQIFKIGESTYCEVFCCTKLKDQDNNDKSSLGSDNDKLVLKIIPIQTAEDSVENSEQLPYQSPIIDAVHELLTTKNLSSSEKKATVVIGKYPQHLLNIWRAFDDQHGAENYFPGAFGSTQPYLIICQAYGGIDLEHFIIRSVNQSFSILRQICYALIYAENKYHFEHRDLHLGNILILNTDEDKILVPRVKNRNLHEEVATGGILCQIIDYSLSRMEPDLSEGKENEVVYRDLANEKHIFSGDATIDVQYEAYRQMKAAIDHHANGNWQNFVPETNSIWSKMNQKGIIIMKKLEKSLLENTERLEDWYHQNMSLLNEY